MFEYDEQQGALFQQDVLAAYAAAGHPLDYANVVWSNRMTWDARNLGYPDSRRKHLATLKSQLGRPVPVPPVGLSANLVTNGSFFALDNGDHWSAVQASDFPLLAKHQNGEDITRQLAQRAGYGFNLLRVWTLFDISTVGQFTSLDYARLPAFVELCASFGLYVEFTAYTGINDPDHWNNLCLAALDCRIRPLLELVNELDQNTNEPDSLGRVFDLSLHHQAPWPLLSSHGSNGSQAIAVRPPWSYEEFHTNDAPEWPRKTGHNAMELSDGAEGLIASRVPVLTNENTRFPDRCDSPAMAFDAAAGAALLCAGSCFHSVNGRQGLLWTDVEADCARSWAEGARSVPLAAQAGFYRRLDPGPGQSRVYQRVLADGTAYTVVIRNG